MQLVGQPRDDALHLLQLLVEILAQPRQLFDVAKLFGLDRLVICLGEDLVGGLVLVFAEIVRAPGLLTFALVVLGFAFHRHVVGIDFDGLLVAFLAFAFGIFDLIGGGAFGLLGFAGLTVVGAFLALAFLIVVVAGILAAVFAEIFAHIEVAQKIARRTGKGRLVFQKVMQMFERLAGLVFHQLAPLRHQLFGGGWRCFAGQLFAHDHGQRFGKRGFVARGDLFVAAFVKFLLKRRGEVVRRAFHLRGADGFAARLLECVENLKRFAALGLQLDGRLVVVMGKAQGVGIRHAAHAGHFFGRKVPARHGQARAQAPQAGGLRAIGHVQLGLFRHGFHGGSQRALERFCRSFLGHSSCDA